MHSQRLQAAANSLYAPVFTAYRYRDNAAALMVAGETRNAVGETVLGNC